MATLADINATLQQQSNILERLVSVQERSELDARRSRLDLLEQARERAVGAIAGAPARAAQAVGRIGSGGSFLGGLSGSALGSLGGLTGIAALGALGMGLIDANKIKDNVETLLSIGDRYSGDGADILARIGQDGAVIIGLGALGKALSSFAVGGAFNAGVDYFASDWASNVVKNVETLLSIGANFDLSTLGGFGDAAKAAALPIFLGALGKGLTAFAVGSGATGLADGIHEFIGIGADNWAENVKRNVESLLSINIGSGVIESLGSILKGGTLAIIMGELAAGLAIFSVGSGATGIADAIHNFVGFGENWGEKVKNNIEALLSIGNLETATLANVTGVMGSLIAISAGLAVFGGGAAVSGIGQGVAELQQSLNLEEVKKGITFLVNGGGDAPNNWAQQVVENVKTLLSIGDITNVGNLGDFVGSMTSIAAGLAVFGGGAGIVAGGVAVADIVAGVRFMTGGDGPDAPPKGWVSQLKNDISNLLSIDFGNASGFKDGMVDMAAGMIAFFGSNGLNQLTGLVTDVVGVIRNLFRSDADGVRSPIDDVVDAVNKIGAVDDANIAKLGAFATGLDNLFSSFRQFGEADIGDVFTANITKMIKNVGAVLDMWPYLLNGDEWPGQRWGFGDNIDFGDGLRGFMSDSKGIEDVTQGIRQLYGALGVSPVESNISPATGNGMQATTLRDLYVENLVAERMAAGSVIINAPTDARSTTTSNSGVSLSGRLTASDLQRMLREQMLQRPGR